MKGRVMAENGNGYWAKWLVGVVTTCIITALTMIGTNVIANDQNSRLRDDCLDDKFNAYAKEQTKINGDILVVLADIKADVRWVKNKM